MIAALPMYDRPETRDATDRFWALIRDRLRASGFDAPDHLTRDRDPWDIWTDPDLLLAQTCGLPFRAKLKDRVALVGTPDFALPGCAAGHYYSVIVARDALPPTPPRVAVNDPLSQSGWSALWHWALDNSVTLGPRLMTGGHAASARAVFDGRAELAAIDAQTWRLLCRHEIWATHLRELARTAPTPGLPLITAKGCDPVPIRQAVGTAIADMSQADRDTLGLVGLAAIPAAAYLALPLPPEP